MKPSNGHSRKNSLTPVTPLDTSNDSEDDFFKTIESHPPFTASPVPRRAPTRHGLKSSTTTLPTAQYHPNIPQAPSQTPPPSNRPTPITSTFKLGSAALALFIIYKLRPLLPFFLAHFRKLRTKLLSPITTTTAATAALSSANYLPLSTLQSYTGSSLTITPDYIQTPLGRIAYPPALLPFILKPILASKNNVSVNYAPTPPSLVARVATVVIPAVYLYFMKTMFDAITNKDNESSTHFTSGFTHHTRRNVPPNKPTLAKYAHPPTLPPIPPLFSLCTMQPMPPPTGFILHGPTGCGKSYFCNCLLNSLHKELADNVEFYTVKVSGSDFIEKYVGVGAARVRGLYKEMRSVCGKRKKLGKRCFGIIVIDEIDSVATSRRTITHEGGSEGDGTLNQLLCELDGLDEKGVTVVTIGTTNRRSMLDTALTRPGRFDGLYELFPPQSRKGVMDLLAVHGVNCSFHDWRVEECLECTQAEISQKVKEWQWEEAINSKLG